MRSWRAILVAAALAALSMLMVVVAPAVPAASPAYVALGDSYSSGTGTRSYLDDGTSCQRSVYAYPSLIAAAKGYSLNFRACSGAKVSDVRTNQLGALSTSTGYVTISVGGNDAGFSSVLTTCAQPSWMSNCNAAIDKAQAYINNTLPGSLASLYSDIRSRAPYAKVVVVGYPRIFNGEDCNAFTWFSPTEEARLNTTADLLNSKTSAAASAQGFTFSSPSSRFMGHAVCDDVEWINGLSSPTSESYHPNRAGHSSGFTYLVSPLLTGSTVTVTSSVLRQARGSADSLAAQQRQHSVEDSTIEPELFTVPDLHSPQALRAAARAGVDVDDPTSVNAADRAYARLEARAWRLSAR
jgi:hypothetical protein